MKKGTQFVITAFDHVDPEARKRRADVRPRHLARLMVLADARVLSGGAILDDAGEVVGSSMHVEFPDRDALDAWLVHEPYITARVWDQIDIRPFRQADLTCTDPS